MNLKWTLRDAMFDRNAAHQSPSDFCIAEKRCLPFSHWNRIKVPAWEGKVLERNQKQFRKQRRNCNNMQNCKSQTLLNKNQGTTTFVKISPLLQTHLHSEAQCVIRLGIGKNKNIRQPDNTTAVNKSEQNKIICSSEEKGHQCVSKW